MFHAPVAAWLGTLAETPEERSGAVEAAWEGNWAERL